MGEPGIEALLRFAAYAAQPDDALDLALGALLIAETAYPTLDVRRYLRRLDSLAASVRAALGMGAGARLSAEQRTQSEVAERTLAALRAILVAREGFTGNREQYYEPANSFLNDVLERHTGLPITLSIVYIEVARRLGAPLVGVGLPTHFVVKWPLPEEEGGDLFVDPFADGKQMDYYECRRFVLRLMSSGPGGPYIDERWFIPIGTRALLTRLLTNLKVVYLHRGETAAALEIVDRLVLLRPDLVSELRDRGLLRLALGDTLLAAADIAAYAERAPLAPEIGRLRRRLTTLSEVRGKLN